MPKFNDHFSILERGSPWSLQSPFANNNLYKPPPPKHTPLLLLTKAQPHDISISTMPSLPLSPPVIPLAGPRFSLVCPRSFPPPRQAPPHPLRLLLAPRPRPCRCFCPRLPVWLEVKDSLSPDGVSSDRSSSSRPSLLPPPLPLVSLW